jgi:hypothetical protein
MAVKSFSFIISIMCFPKSDTLFWDQKTTVIKKEQHFHVTLLSSPSWARTKDPLINSQML